MRLTSELIQSSLSYLNPLKERELDLRGHKIPAIENLGVAGPHDAIDFTDNDIQMLGNFPLSTRLRTLLLARNRITSIQPNLANSLPNLTTLVLTSNNFAELADLDVLGSFRSLTHIVLMENPVTKKEVSYFYSLIYSGVLMVLLYYRLWVIWRCPSVRFFDYKKVKDVERKKAQELFGSAEAPTDLATSIIEAKTKTIGMHTIDKSTKVAKNYRVKLTDKERKKVEELIRNAKSLQEIIRLEKELNSGRIPAAALDSGDAMEE